MSTLLGAEHQAHYKQAVRAPTQASVQQCVVALQCVLRISGLTAKRQWGSRSFLASQDLVQQLATFLPPAPGVHPRVRQPHLLMVPRTAALMYIHQKFLVDTSAFQ